MASTLANENSFAVPYVSVPLTMNGRNMAQNIQGGVSHYGTRAPWAIVDLDDVIGDFSTLFLDYLMTEHQHVLQLFTGHYGLHAALIKDLGEERGTEILRNFYDGKQIRRVPLIPGAWRFLRKLKRLGFHLHALTGRPGWKHYATVRETLGWVADYDLPFDSVNFCIQKGKFIRHAMKAPMDGSKIIIGLEDNAEHALDMANYCTKVYLRQKHYNHGTVDRKLKPYSKFSTVLEDVLADLTRKNYPSTFYPQTSLDLSRR